MKEEEYYPVISLCIEYLFDSRISITIVKEWQEKLSMFTCLLSAFPSPVIQELVLACK